MEKLNIAEILKDCPSGMELDCTVYDNVTFGCIMDGNCYPIQIQTPEGNMLLSEYGCMSLSTHSKCVIFPKGKTTWEGFVPPYKFKDGDIISNDRFIAIFHRTDKPNNCVSSNVVYYHCFLNIKYGGFKAKIDYGIGNIEEYKYATEEEKEKLFQAIKDNGYKWNEETKTLEKLPKFKVGDRIKHKENTRWVCTIRRVEDRYYVDGHPTCYTLLFDKQDEYELVPNKFDISTLVPLESKVLVRNVGAWLPAFWGYYEKEYTYPFVVDGGNTFAQCIPYEGNEHLCGTTNDCDEFYKTWE